MGKNTKISWCDHTFNPFWGCCKISSGCENCYAEALSKRFGHEKHWGYQAVRRHFGIKHWREPLTWDMKAIKNEVVETVFCGSMCDIFESNPNDDILDYDRKQLWGLIEKTDNLFWLLLTKRLENVITMTPWHWNHWPDNIALGTSIEDQHAAEIRIPVLLKMPARYKFLSIEPLIDHVDLEVNIDWLYEQTPVAIPHPDYGYQGGEYDIHPRGDIHQIIVGGESGPKARPIDLDWVRDLREQCHLAEIPFFVKQLGSHWARSNRVYTKSKKGENMEFWPEDLRIRQIPAEFIKKDRKAQV